MASKILFSNLGYARGISGQLADHLRYAYRHFYSSPAAQKKSLKQLYNVITHEDPDICCFVEIDQGSFSSAGFNQLEVLIGEKYAYFDIENKYGPASSLRRFFITKGKSNAFIAKHPIPHEKIYFEHGIKRLVYKVQLRHDLTLFFAHFSLNKGVRAKQLDEVAKLTGATKGEVIFLGDFNILTGMNELAPLLKHQRMVLVNKEDTPTFKFHKRALVLDLCIASKNIARQIDLKVIPQPYSDHAALMLNINTLNV